jgi:hypothetical protein
MVPTPTSYMIRPFKSDYFILIGWLGRETTNASDMIGPEFVV